MSEYKSERNWINNDPLTIVDLGSLHFCLEYRSVEIYGCEIGLTAKEFDMALKTKVREYREKAGYKQSELAEMVNARRETIVHLENGKYNPSLKLAMDIAKVFHVTVEELFEFTED